MHIPSATFPIRWRLALLASHLVVALVALVVIGGATRVMEAGLACPDWPLCYGSLLPGRHMNMQVFLEWFHRLDAFLIGIALLVQFSFSLAWRRNLPNWLPWVYGSLVLLVGFQGALGALTVLQLLPSLVVIAHLAVALILVGGMSSLTQFLMSSNSGNSPFWWRCLGVSSLVAVFSQSLLGSRMATTWAAQSCIHQGTTCLWLDIHRFTAIPVAILVLVFVFTSICAGGWPRTQWPFLLAVCLLLVTQICLGVISIEIEISEPILTIAHQLIAALLVALLAALTVRRPERDIPQVKHFLDESFMEHCHG